MSTMIRKSSTMTIVSTSTETRETICPTSTNTKKRVFAHETTIHGLFHMNQAFEKHHTTRFSWLAIVLASLSCCICQSILNIQDYITFNVTISTSFENSPRQMYPAITFWNQNGEKRTVIGRRKAMMIVATVFGGDTEGIKEVYERINKTCLYESKSPDIVDQTLKRFNAADLYHQSEDAVLAALEFAMMTRENSFITCWWDNKEVECERLVLTTITDLSKAFSVNLHSNVANNFFGNESGVGFTNTKFDKTMTQLFSSSKEQRFQFLINVNPDEYCAHMKQIWYGVGFNMKFHDPLTLPSGQLGTSILLLPGYQYNIAIKPVQHIRDTEHMGKCLSKISLYMFPETKTYVKELCLNQCENEIAWKMCGCLSTMLKTAARAFVKHHNLNQSESERICAMSDRKCMMDLLDNLMAKHNLENYYCPYCKQPCRETEYNYQITATVFPPNQHQLYYSEALNLTAPDGESIRKSYIMLNIFFETFLVNVVKESQWFTLKDLFIYIGNNVSLFMGMSFMSFGEIIQYLTEFVIKAAKAIQKKCNKRKKMKVLLRNIKVRPSIVDISID